MDMPGAVTSPDRCRLRDVLHATPVAALPDRDEGSRTESLTPASVLFPLIPRADGFFVLLTQRTDHLRDHPGQISFPGGRVEPEDLSPAHTAMREARDATLAMPTLILPAVQTNIRAGALPDPEDNGVRYLKLPIDTI